MKDLLPLLDNETKLLISPEEVSVLISFFNSVVLEAFPELYKEDDIIEIISPLTLKNRLEPGHLISSFIDEHNMILSFIIKMDLSLKIIQKINHYQEAKEEIKKLMQNLNYLIGSEAHYQKEETVLFPEMKKRTNYELLKMLKAEYDIIRKYQEELKKLISHLNPLNYLELKEKIVNTAFLYCNKLKIEIYKENYIFYPIALKIIKEEEIWHKMKTKCYYIGPCSFILQPPLT